MSIVTLCNSDITFFSNRRKVWETVSKVRLRLNLEPLMERKGKELGKARITQEELAEMTNIQQGTLSRWINNKVDVYKRETLEKLMQVFNCNLEDLFEVTLEEE